MNPKCCQSPILSIIMKISKMANIVYRQMPAPREPPQQILAGRAKAWMQKPHGGANFWCRSPGEWLWMKLIPALPQLHLSLRHCNDLRAISHKNGSLLVNTFFAGLSILSNKVDVSRSRITVFIPVSEYEAVGLR